MFQPLLVLMKLWYFALWVQLLQLCSVESIVLDSVVALLVYLQCA